MKKTLLTIASLFSTIASFAQVESNYNYSIGIKGYSIIQMPKILDQTNESDFTTMWLNGGMLKFNDNQMAIRISGHYLYKRDYTFKNQCDNCEETKGNVTDYAIKLGFEKNFNYSVIQPYFAADLGFRSNSFKGNSQPIASNISTPYSSIASKKGLTFGPTIGVKINVLSQVSFFAESSFDFFYAYERRETVYNDLSNTRTFAKYRKFDYLLNPVTAGIQLHLIGKN